ncbi:TonB-dependent receptor [Duganella sp. Root198D2]|uniref:TonB-dependent receptor n=1 Tax=Duganella sp. Root198D2 TaxID=1736489 RepID=UPI00070FB264|nr:TonB-dependent receptor [Duganella sp. Root198D2]KRC00724.1 outer membrane hemin/siderophore receptor protein [Duganella sp. Root198D2]
MTIISSRCALAVAVAVCFAAPAQAQSQTDTVVISGSRFASDPSLLPIGATTISAADIRRAGVSDVNQAIRKIGGVYGRQSLTGSPDFGLDLRGFGTFSDQNVVIVLDGVRLNENEQLAATLSTIPIDRVQSIDIMRGGASVLYGEGATGGVIRITTKRPQAGERSGNVFTEAGQFNSSEVRASLAQGFDSYAFDLSAGHQRTDNYRDNNDFKQSRINGGVQFNTGVGRFSLRADIARQDQRFAGGLSEGQFLLEPRQTLTPNDFGKLDSDRYTAAWEHKVGAFDLAAELSHRKKESEGVYSGFKSAYDSKQTQFSPRVRHLGQFDGLLNELVAGFDFSRWNRVTHAFFSAADVEQRSKAFYLRDEMKFSGPQQFRLAAGVRRELFDKDSADSVPFGANYSQKQAHNAWEAQGSMLAAPGLTAWAKVGQSYRVANVDDNAFTPVPGKPLETQVSHDAEIGLGYAAGDAKLDARVFRHKLDNEIYFDPTIFVNTNLAPTQRKGFELDGSYRLAPEWQVQGHFQQVEAEFRSGPNAGRELALVPKNILTVRLAWLPADGQSADIGVQRVGKQRYGSDFDNSCDARMPAYTVVDGRYARKFGQWELALSALNLFDKDHYSQAFSCRGGIYPNSGRQLKVSARYDF